MGIELPIQRGQPDATPGHCPPISSLLAECRPRLDLCQNCANALPDPVGLRSRSTMSTAVKTKLYTLLGDYPNTMALKKGEVTSRLVEFEFADVKVSNTAFKPLVREAKFDLGELAIVTYLQAKAYGKPYVLIPATVLGRGQHHTVAYNPQRGPLRISDLTGKRVGVRAYTQTTGAWVRGFLTDDYGVDPGKIRWVTFEDPHLAEYHEPEFVTRAPQGKTLVQMLLDGE